MRWKFLLYFLLASVLTISFLSMPHDAVHERSSGEEVSNFSDDEDESDEGTGAVPRVEASIEPQKVRKITLEEEREVSGVELMALFQTHNQLIASAVIFIEGYGAYRFKVGEYVAQNIHLLAILPDRVLIRLSDGDIDAVYLKALEQGRINSVADELPKESSLVISDEETEVELSTAQIRRKAFLQQVDLHPVTAGTASGYIVGDRFPEDAVKSTGITAGDVIVSVNGYPVGEEVSDVLAWHSVSSTESAVVVVRRAGQEFTVYYP